MKIAEFKKKNYNTVLQALKKGGLVICPTDTVYGLLSDSTNENAVQKLIQFKDRPPGKAISIFLSDFTMMKKYVDVNPKQEAVLEQLLPGPFTIVLHSRHKTSKLLESEKGALGIRIPDFPFITELVKRFGKPVSATSANLSGRSPHYKIDTFFNEIPQFKKDLIDVIIDAGDLPHNKPSTVLDLSTATIKTLRYGDIIQKDSRSFISASEDQTKKIGQYLLQKYSKKTEKKPLVFIIQGELGVGKTVMVKGIAEKLGIKDIVSPTFVVYYEYKTSAKKIKLFYHFDLYQLQDSEEFKYLHIENLLKPYALLCFEWGEKTEEIIDLLKDKAEIVYIRMKYISEEERKIIVKN